MINCFGHTITMRSWILRWWGCYFCQFLLGSVMDRRDEGGGGRWASDPWRTGNIDDLLLDNAALPVFWPVNAQNIIVPRSDTHKWRWRPGGLVWNRVRRATRVLWPLLLHLATCIDTGSEWWTLTTAFVTNPLRRIGRRRRRRRVRNPARPSPVSI